MKVIIAGGRDFNDYTLLKFKCDKILRDKTVTEIVSGKCPTGADYLGERYARERGYPVNPFPANWERDGKVAGVMRNHKMAEYADCLIIFWNGSSRGSTSMIKAAHLNGLPIRIIKYA